MNLSDFKKGLGSLSECKEGEFRVRSKIVEDGTLQWSYESREISGKIVRIMTTKVDKKYDGVELKLFVPYAKNPFQTVEYPRVFTLDEEKKLLNQEVRHCRIQEIYEENFLFGGQSYQREYKIDILTGELTFLSLESRTKF